MSTVCQSMHNAPLLAHGELEEVLLNVSRGRRVSRCPQREWTECGEWQRADRVVREADSWDTREVGRGVGKVAKKQAAGQAQRW